MKTVAIISQKGGAGKTTLAVHLATAAAQAGHSVLILDTDPQASAAQWWHWRGGEGEPEVIDCASHAMLSRKLDQARELGADFVVIDTPPHADIMARTAAQLADAVLIPCKPNAYDLAAVNTTADLIRATGKTAHLVFVGGPPRAPNTYSDARELIEGGANITGMGLPVAPVMLPQRAAFAHSSGSGRTAQEIEPEGRAAEEVAALWDWTRRLVDMPTRRTKKKGRAA